MYLTDDECTFDFDEPLKHSRPGYQQKPLVLRDFPGNALFCPIRVMRKYLDFRLTKCSDKGLFITTTAPHKSCSSATIARWIKTALGNAWIDNGIFQAHSVRSASTSNAKRRGGVTNNYNAISFMVEQDNI